MLASHLFYNKKALLSIQPFIRTNTDHQNPTNNVDSSHSKVQQFKSIIQFPVRFTNRNQKSKDIKFYEKYLSVKVFKQLFVNTIKGISQLSKNQIAVPVCASNMEPVMLKKMRQYFSVNRNVLEVESIELKSTNIIEHCAFKGVFMHRTLNMPGQSYSVEVPDEKNVILRMRNKMTNPQHIKMLNQKLSRYDSNQYQLQRYYMDSYHNFIKNQKVLRMLIEVNAVITGRFITKEGTQVPLPIDRGRPITTHLMQLEKIEVPGRTDLEKCLVTDIDYFMHGNPFTA